MALNKKLVAYYKIGHKYDTPLDSLEVQKKRVKYWVDKFGCDIMAEFTDTEDSLRYSRDDAFWYATENDCCVIVSGLSRIADTPLEYLGLRNDKS